MKQTKWSIGRRQLVLAAMLAGVAGAAHAQSQYTVSVSLDYTGPFANVMDSWWADSNRSSTGGTRRVASS